MEQQIKFETLFLIKDALNIVNVVSTSKAGAVYLHLPKTSYNIYKYNPSFP